MGQPQAAGRQRCQHALIQLQHCLSLRTAAAAAAAAVVRGGVITLALGQRRLPRRLDLASHLLLHAAQEAEAVAAHPRHCSSEWRRQGVTNSSRAKWDRCGTGTRSSRRGVQQRAPTGAVFAVLDRRQRRLLEQQLPGLKGLRWDKVWVAAAVKEQSERAGGVCRRKGAVPTHTRLPLRMSHLCGKHAAALAAASILPHLQPKALGQLQAAMRTRVAAVGQQQEATAGGGGGSGGPGQRGPLTLNREC